MFNDSFLINVENMKELKMGVGDGVSTGGVGRPQAAN